MITSQQLFETLKDYDSEAISEAKSANDGSVHALVVNRVDPGSPYMLLICSACDGQVLHFGIRSSHRIQLDSVVPKTLMHVNSSLGFGHLAINGKNCVVYMFNYICRQDDDNDPPPELFKTVLDKMLSNLPSIDKALMAGRMADAGFSEDTAKSITRVLFSRGKNNGPSVDGLNGA